MQLIHMSPKGPLSSYKRRGPRTPVSSEWKNQGTRFRYEEPASHGLTHLLCQVFLDALSDAGWREAEGPAVIRRRSGRLHLHGVREEGWASGPRRIIYLTECSGHLQY